MKRTRKFNLNNLKDLKEAERTRDRLNNQYDYVRMVMVGNNIAYIEYK